MKKVIACLLLIIFFTCCEGKVSEHDLVNNAEQLAESTYFDIYKYLKQGEILTLNKKEYEEIFYDVAIREKTKPTSFRISENLAEEIFRILVQEYYFFTDINFLTLDEYEDYYIITGGNRVETLYGGITEIRSCVFTLILRISDGSIVSLFRQI